MQWLGLECMHPIRIYSVILCLVPMNGYVKKCGIKRRLANFFSILGMAISPPWRVWSWTGTRSCPAEKSGTGPTTIKWRKHAFWWLHSWNKMEISRNQNHMSINDLHGVSGLVWDKYCKMHWHNKNWWLTFESKCRPQIPHIYTYILTTRSRQFNLLNKKGGFGLSGGDVYHPLPNLHFMRS